MSRRDEHTAAESGSPARWAARAALMVLLSCFATETRADITSFLPGSDREARPCRFDSISTGRPPGAEATRVELGLRVLDLIRVDDAAQTFSLDFVVFADWQDQRLGRQVGERGPCTLALERVWNPALALVGKRDIRPELEDRVVVKSDGSVRYMQRFIGSLRSTADLRDFPLDARELTIRFVAAGYSPHDVAFVGDEERTGLLPGPSVTDWILGEAALTVETYALEAGSQSLASIRYTIPARRRAGAFANRFGIPLLLIVMMSWIPFWISPEALGPRLSLASLAMLNVIAFQLVLRGLLPPVAYLSRADWIASGAMILVFTALVESAAAGVLYMRGRADLSQRLDRLSRAAAPLATIGLLVLSAGL